MARNIILSKWSELQCTCIATCFFFFSEVRELERFEVLNSGVAEDSSLLGCYTVLLGNELLAFWNEHDVCIFQDWAVQEDFSLCGWWRWRQHNPFKHTNYPATQRHIPQDVNPHQHCCVNLKSFKTSELLLRTAVLLYANHTVLRTLMHINDQYKFAMMKMQNMHTHTYIYKVVQIWPGLICV